jgi:NADH dehydrogenase
MQHIVVIGGGFAGLWSAVGAARKLDELGVRPDRVLVTLINRDAFHGIRVRFYEPDLRDVRVPLDDVLGPVGVRRLEGSVTGIDFAASVVSVETAAGPAGVPYDRLVLAAGSRLHRPDVPGLREHALSVDTYAEAAALAEHLHGLHRRPRAPGRSTAVIIGAGPTGIEAACEMPARLRGAAGPGGGNGAAAAARVILVDSAPTIGSHLGRHARPVIEEALAGLSVEVRTHVTAHAIDPAGVTLDTGERIPALTTVWAAGMRASALTECFPVERDRLGRLPVDRFLKVRGMEHVFAAGDVARALVDGEHAAMMSCQFGRPMGRLAGHNVVCDLLGAEPLPMHIEHYSTILDLGPWGALYTTGWDRKILAAGAAAKETKRTINCVRIYPPRTRDRRAILDAAAPVLQAPPPTKVG